MLQIRRFESKNIFKKNNLVKEENKKIICAFSGGPDSVFLALWLQKKFGMTGREEKNIIIAHFNHNLRGEESEREEKFSREFAQKNNFLFETEKWESPEKSEEKARNARYRFLEKIRKKYNADWICTGHHMNDMSETVLFQFFRGGAISALSGIVEKDKKRKIWRPLLNISKQEILEYLEDNNQKYCIDSSNLENNYTRNFLRNEIIPDLEETFPNLSKRIAQKTKYFSEVQKILEERAEIFLEKNPIEKGIEREKFFAEKFPIRCEVLKKLFPRHSWTQEKFVQLEKFLKEGKSGKKFVTRSFQLEIFGGKFF